MHLGRTGWSVLAVVVACVGWSANHHVVKTRQGTLVIQKRFLSLHDTFVNTRSWSGHDFKAHPQLRDALVQAGYGDVVTDQRLVALEARYREAKAQAALLLAEIKTETMARTANWLDETYHYWFAKN